MTRLGDFSEIGLLWREDEETPKIAKIWDTFYKGIFFYFFTQKVVSKHGLLYIILGFKSCLLQMFWTFKFNFDVDSLDFLTWWLFWQLFSTIGLLFSNFWHIFCIIWSHCPKITPALIPNIRPCWNWLTTKNWPAYRSFECLGRKKFYGTCPQMPVIKISR